MKSLVVRTSVAIAAVLLLSLWLALGKDGLGTQDGSGTHAAGHSTPASSGGGGGASAAARPTTSSVGRTSDLENTLYGPSLQGTSFTNISSYYVWHDYYSDLLNHFDINPAYFGRFYRNAEPLITPMMLKLTLREPLSLSSEMLDSIDQLQEMLGPDGSGSSANRLTLAEKSKHIRELAKQIRHNQTLAYFDLREKRSLYSQSENGTLSPETVQKLRGMAVDLDRQLRNMYSQSSTSTVSVSSYKEPSLESLAKGIEKICKVIETHSKKM
jgi:hypothetical protein